MQRIPEAGGCTKPPPPQDVPEGMEVLHTTEASAGSIGHAVILAGRLPDFYRCHPTSTTIAFLLHGTAKIEWKRGSRLARYVATPGHFTIVPAGEDNVFRMDRPVQCLKLSFDSAQLRSLVDREWEPNARSVEFTPVHQKNTPEIVALGQAFAALLRSPRRGGGLYAETLWTQIAVQLLWNFSSLPRQGEPWVQRLSDARVRRVVDYLEASLAEEVALADLADLVGLSPNHFLSAFKKATGKTPHRYLTERRVAKACELLHNPQTPIANVALAVGFSSQSHLTTVFGRFVGTTPASYRAQVLGIGPDAG